MRLPLIGLRFWTSQVKSVLFCSVLFQTVYTILIPAVVSNKTHSAGRVHPPRRFTTIHSQHGHSTDRPRELSIASGDREERAIRGTHTHTRARMHAHAHTHTRLFSAESALTRFVVSFSPPLLVLPPTRSCRRLKWLNPWQALVTVRRAHQQDRQPRSVTCNCELLSTRLSQ